MASGFLGIHSKIVVNERVQKLAKRFLDNSLGTL